jgi:ankyrin repeat protein
MVEPPSYLFGPQSPIGVQDLYENRTTTLSDFQESSNTISYVCKCLDLQSTLSLLESGISQEVIDDLANFYYKYHFYYGVMFVKNTCEIPILHNLNTLLEDKTYSPTQDATTILNVLSKYNLVQHFLLKNNLLSLLEFYTRYYVIHYEEEDINCVLSTLKTGKSTLKTLNYLKSIPSISQVVKNHIYEKELQIVIENDDVEEFKRIAFKPIRYLNDVIYTNSVKIIKWLLSKTSGYYLDSILNDCAIITLIENKNYDILEILLEKKIQLYSIIFVNVDFAHFVYYVSKIRSAEHRRKLSIGTCYIIHKLLLSCQYEKVYYIIYCTEKYEVDYDDDSYLFLLKIRDIPEKLRQILISKLLSHDLIKYGDPLISLSKRDLLEYYDIIINSNFTINTLQIALFMAKKYKAVKIAERLQQTIECRIKLDKNAATINYEKLLSNCRDADDLQILFEVYGKDNFRKLIREYIGNSTTNLFCIIFEAFTRDLTQKEKEQLLYISIFEKDVEIVQFLIEKVEVPLLSVYACVYCSNNIIILDSLLSKVQINEQILNDLCSYNEFISSYLQYKFLVETPLSTNDNLEKCSLEEIHTIVKETSLTRKEKIYKEVY